MEIRYPDVKVQLTGEDSNAYNIIGLIGMALKRAGVHDEEVKEFQDEAMSGDYDNVLTTAMRWVDIR